MKDGYFFGEQNDDRDGERDCCTAVCVERDGGTDVAADSDRHTAGLEDARFLPPLCNMSDQKNTVTMA